MLKKKAHSQTRKKHEAPSCKIEGKGSVKRRSVSSEVSIVIDFNHEKFHWRISSLHPSLSPSKRWIPLSACFSALDGHLLPFLMPVVLDSWRNKKERARSLDNITRGIRGRQNDGVASHADELFCSQNNQSSRQCFRPARFSLSAQLSATYFSPSGFPISAIRNIPRKLERSCFLLLCQGS